MHDAMIRNFTGDIGPHPAQAWVAFDFGDGGMVGGEIQPGIANEATADYLMANAIDPETMLPTVQINVQTLVAKALMAKCKGIEKSDLFRIVGQPTDDNEYVDSWMVAEQARENISWAQADAKLDAAQMERRREGLPIGVIAVAAVAGHAGRARWQTEKAFAGTAMVYAPGDLPNIYAGPNSTQWWTRNATVWWLKEIAVRAACGVGGGPPASLGDLLTLRRANNRLRQNA